MLLAVNLDHQKPVRYSHIHRFVILVRPCNSPDFNHAVEAGKNLLLLLLTAVDLESDWMGTFVARNAAPFCPRLAYAGPLQLHHGMQVWARHARSRQMRALGVLLT